MYVELTFTTVCFSRIIVVFMLIQSDFACGIRIEAG